MKVLPRHIKAKDYYMKKGMKILLPFLFLFLLAGCNREVITVAGVEGAVQEEQATQYIEIEEFELKEPEEVYEGEKVLSCAVLIPEGYVQSEEIPGMYIHERYPVEASNIYYSVSKGDKEGIVSKELTEEQYKQLVEEAYKKSGMEADLEIISFEQTEREGVPVYKICSSYAKDAKWVQQLTYMVLAEDTHMITYTQLSDDEMMEDFTVAEGQIKLVIAEK